jgi:hypothetical protein
MIGNNFYVVWLDPDHNLHPDDRHGGIKVYKYPAQNSYEKKCAECEVLKKINEELKSILEEKTKP